jgi:hypothetical protein
VPPSPSNRNFLRVSAVAASVLVGICALRSREFAQKAPGPLASASRLSEYVIQGAANDERVQFLLQHPVDNEHSMLIEALKEQSAAWNALLERIQSWTPTPQELQQQIPQQMAQLVTLAHSSLLQSVGTIKKSAKYTWLAGRLTSSLAKVNSLQSHFKRMLAPGTSEKPSSKVSPHAHKVNTREPTRNRS